MDQFSHVHHLHVKGIGYSQTDGHFPPGGGVLGDACIQPAAFLFPLKFDDKCSTSGVIRSIDPEAKCFYVITGVCVTDLARVNCLLKGALDLPRQILFNQVRTVFRVSSAETRWDWIYGMIGR